MSAASRFRGMGNGLRCLAVLVLLSGCGLGIRGTGPSKPAERQRTEDPRYQRARRECVPDIEHDVLKERLKHQRAKRNLKAASERLRVAEQLGDPPTIVQAMKDRDEAQEAVLQTWYPTDKDQKELTDKCIRSFVKHGL